MGGVLRGGIGVPLGSVGESMGSVRGYKGVCRGGYLVWGGDLGGYNEMCGWGGGVGVYGGIWGWGCEYGGGPQGVPFGEGGLHGWKGGEVRLCL